MTTTGWKWNFMLTKQNLKSQKPLPLFRISPKWGPLVPHSLHPFRAKLHCPCPSPSPALSKSQQQTQTPAWEGWSCLGPLCQPLLSREWGGGKAAGLSPNTQLVSQPGTASWHQQHGSLQMSEREHAGGSGETLQLPLLTLEISAT